MTYNGARRSARKVATRALMLSVATRLFAASGYDAVTMRGIARAAGRSTGSIFANWRDKDALFAEAMGRPHLTDERGASLLAELQALAPSKADELLKRWAA